MCIKNMFFKLFIIILIQSSCSAHKLKLGPCVLQYFEPCSKNTIQFYLFSSDRSINEAPTLINSSKPELPNWVDLRKNMKIIVHGYAGNLDFNATRTVRNAYLNKINTNIIVVDWGKMAELPCYPTAAINTKQAGECTAVMLMNLKGLYKEFDMERVHAIGFSLGAHVVGFTSNYLERTIGMKLTRITGLDPALPFFATSDFDWKLDKNDADFVDVIHTNAGIYGKIEQCGDVDFYVNGGQNQPGCNKHKNTKLCSHMLSAAYFAESIISGVGFWGVQCPSYFQYIFGFCSDELHLKKRIAMMGDKCSTKSTGIYFVSTRERPPYAIGRGNNKYFKQKKVILNNNNFL